MRKTLLMLFGVLLTLPALARDFEYTYEGQTLTYTVISEQDKTVMLKEGSYDYSTKTYLPGNNVSGKLIIPEIAKDGNVEFTVSSIGGYAFSNCSGLTEVAIPNSVTSIGNSAFQYCSGLTQVTIPNSVTKIDAGAFSYCSGLTEVAIPNSVTSIGNSAFQYCSGLTQVTIPNSVTSISDSAFQYCRGLTEVTIGNSVTSIGNYAFWDCSGLTEVTIPNSVTSIGISAFNGCSGLTEVTIPNSVTSIGHEVFTYCSGLKSINVESLNSNFSSIDGVLFNKDASVLLAFPAGKTGDYVIPNSVTSIGHGAFLGCRKLPGVIIPESVTSIDNGAFFGCWSLPAVIIPNSVTSIGNEAFWECRGLKQVTIGNSVTEIGGYAFALCSALTSVTIPNSVISIGHEAFRGCSGLSQVTIGNSVTTIDYGAFYGCSGLTSIYAYPTVPPTLGNNVFGNVTNTIPVYVPASSVDAYRSAKGWDYFSDFREIGSEVVELAVTLNETALELKEGETATLTATVTKPGNVTVTAEEWTSSDEAVATVDNGTVTAVAEGKATITYTATFSSGETRTATCEVTVIKLSGIEAISAEAGSDAEYFTLQGIRVKADKLAPGVYIRRSDNRTDKILVK